MRIGRFVTTFTIRTTRRDEMVDITRKVAEVVGRAGLANGACVVFVPHTTAGVTINEHADPAVARDILTALDGMVPWDGPYVHDEGNSAAHVKATLTGSSVTALVEDGRLSLGTWQGVFLCEYDGPRTREVWVSCMPAP